MKKKYIQNILLAIAAITLLLLTLVGCGTQETNEAQVEQSFNGSEWIATAIYDSSGNLYESDFTYRLRFMNESQIEITPDLYIEGYVYGSSQGFYQYEINNGSLILKDSLLADAPEVVNFNENVIELRSVQDSGSLFHFERADALQNGENTTSANPEVNANASQLAGTVWTASRDDVDFELRLEFYSDNECFIGRLAEGNWIAVEACTYRFTDGELTIGSGMLLDASLEGDYISATTSGDGLLWTFRLSDSPLTTEATREALLRTVYQSGANGSENENTDANTGDATQNADGTWRYHILDHDWDLRVRIEDYIDGDEVNLSAIKEALGYTRGKVRDTNGDVLAETGETLYSSPYSTLSFGENWHTDSYISFKIQSANQPSSRVFHYTYSENDCYITKNQLIVAVYIWGVYSDGLIHENPCAGLLDEYARNEAGKVVHYTIP